MLIGISLFGVAIAQLSAGILMEELNSDISGPEDLDRRLVATVRGITSGEVARRYGASLAEVDQIEDAYLLLKAREVDAVLFDAAPLMRYAAMDGNRTVTVVGPPIEPQVYGIVFPSDSKLRESVNRALLKRRESGRHDQEWFGSAE